MTYKFPCGCTFDILGEPQTKGALPLLKVDLQNLPDCPVTWDIFARGLTKGIFQLEKSLGQHWAKRLRPENIEHLAALGAILRPGCLKSRTEDGISMTEMYCRVKNFECEKPKVEEVVAPILESTSGIMIYQEQLVKISEVIAGFNLEEQDKLRKSVGKKDMKKVNEVGKLFIEKAKLKGIVTEEQAIRMFEEMKKSGRYLFNRCFSKNTIIRRPGTGGRIDGVGYTVEHMYNVRNDTKYAKIHGHESLRKKWKLRGDYGFGLSLYEDGRVRQNKILDIIPSGKQKIFRLTLINGSSIEISKNHKFPTNLGILTLKEILKIKDSVKIYYCGEYEKGNGKIYGFSDKKIEDIKQNNNKSVNKQFGESNFFYTNGSFTDYKNNDKIIPRKCNKCGKDSGRLELHHKNGDRTNSKLENLERLCVSCHKKEEYANGRVRRYEKGYPSELIDIKSIDYIGIEETYDVTMEGPNHNLVTGNNIIASNSHSVSYAIPGYMSAYLKGHFPVQFFANWLYYNKVEQNKDHEDTSSLIEDAKLFDIKVNIPDFRRLDRHFQTNGIDIWFGLADIKGIGESQLNKIVENVKEIEIKIDKKVQKWTWEDFLYNLAGKLSNNAIKGLVSTGAFDWVGKTRTRMLNEVNSLNNLTDLEIEWLANNKLDCPFSEGLKKLGIPKKEGGGVANKNRAQIVLGEADILENPPSSQEDLTSWRLNAEKYYLGAPITISTVDECDTSLSNTTCKEFIDGKDGSIILGVEIKTIRTHKTKSGKNAGSKMAYLSISDGTATLDDVVAFADIYFQYLGLLIQGNTVLLKGERDKKKGSFIIKHVIQI